MTPTAKKRITRLIQVLALVCAVILFPGIWSLLMYGGYGTQVNYVDVNTGRFRHVKSIYDYTFSDVVEESEFSKVWKQYFGPYPEPKWEIQSHFPWFGHHVSPHSGFLGVPIWENWIADVCESPHFNDDVKKIILQRFLGFLQSGEPYRAEKYAQDIFFFEDRDHPKTMVSLTNAPVWILKSPGVTFRIQSIQMYGGQAEFDVMVRNELQEAILIAPAAVAGSVGKASWSDTKGLSWLGFKADTTSASASPEMNMSILLHPGDGRSMIVNLERLESPSSEPPVLQYERFDDVAIILQSTGTALSVGADGAGLTKVRWPEK